MRRNALMAIIVVAVALAAGAPAALAQTSLNVNATYHAQLEAQARPSGQLIGPNVHAVNCPDDAGACGSGTDATLGPFSWAAVGTDVGQTASLTFTTGTLVIDETWQDFNWPGHSQGQSENSAGNPTYVLMSWNVDPAASSGMFTGASGGGTDDALVAGFQVGGAIAGLINLR